MSDILIEQACAALCVALRAAAPELKAAAPVAEVPDVPAAYPSIAILVDRSVDSYWGVDIEVEDADEAPIIIDGSRALMEVGQSAVELRIFLAARTPRERSRTADRIRRAFLDDPDAPTRLMVTMTGLEVDERATGASWPIAFFLEGEDWADEMAFSEKRWTYLRATVDVPILILRGDATPVTTQVVGLNASATTTPAALDTPDQVDTLDPLDLVTVNADGTVGPAPTP